MGKKLNFFTPEQVEKLTDLARRIVAGLQRLEEDKQKLADIFDRQLPAIKHFLEGQKMMLPTDAAEFLMWYLYVKYGDWTPVELHEKWPGIVPNDFKLFHEYKAGLFRHGGNFGDWSSGRLDEDFFFGINAMEKALDAARQAGLIRADETWCYTGEKTHAITIFWRAAVTAGLAKSDTPVYKVVTFLRDRFKMKSLGKNAIDKKKLIKEYDRVFQELYNELLHLMRK